MLGRTALLTLMGLSMAHLPAAAETIRIACQDNFPPFVDVKDGKPVGLVVDILTARRRTGELRSSVRSGAV